MRRHQIVLRHDFVDGTVEAALKAKVTVGDDAHEVVLAVDDRNTADMIFCHDVKSLGNSAAERNRDGVVDHAVFGTLDDSHLASLLLDRHVLMDHADASFTGDGNSHLALGDRVHGCSHEGDVQLNVAREAGAQFHRLWQHL